MSVLKGIGTMQAVQPERKYAIAVRDGSNLFLFLHVRRSPGGEYFAVLARPDRSINAHASYHADGRFHVKTHNMDSRNKIMCCRKQKPDGNFRGAENLLDQSINQAGPRAIGLECDSNKFDAVFEIPLADLGTRTASTRVTVDTHVSIDLVSDSYLPHLVPDARVICQAEYRDFFPYILITLYAMPAF